MVNKYSKVTTAKLKERAQMVFNAWIRDRDKHLPCISCQKARVEQAGHYYAAGKYNHLRFNEDNVHGQCVRCNYYMHGNLIPYRDNLLAKIGQTRFNKLELLAKQRAAHKNDRFHYIEIIEKYK